MRLQDASLGSQSRVKANGRISSSFTCGSGSTAEPFCNTAQKVTIITQQKAVSPHATYNSRAFLHHCQINWQIEKYTFSHIQVKQSMRFRVQQFCQIISDSKNKKHTEKPKEASHSKTHFLSSPPVTSNEVQHQEAHHQRSFSSVREFYFKKV